jgi:hypothetical protein
MRFFLPGASDPKKAEDIYQAIRRFIEERHGALPTSTDRWHIPVPRPQLRARQPNAGGTGRILETKAGHFDPAEFEDRYENAVVEMLKQKQAGMPVRKEAPVAAPSTVVNLMDALKRSIQQERGEKKGKVAEKVSRQSGKRKAG